MKISKQTVVRLGTLSLIVLMGAPFVSLEAQAENTPMELVGSSQETEVKRITGDWPTKTRLVTLKQTAGTVTEALETICKQLDLGLVLDAPVENTGKRITVQLIRKSGRDVLEFVLQSGDLQGELKNGILFVRVSSAGQVAVPVAPSKQEADVRAPLGLDERLARDDRSSRDSHKKHDWKKWMRRHKYYDNDRVQIGKSLHIGKDEIVDKAVVVGGPLIVAGTVLDDAVAVGGSVTLESTAVVNGKAVAIGGAVDVRPGAVLEGQQTAIEIDMGNMLTDEEGNILPWVAGLTGLLGILAIVLRTVMLFVVGLVVIMIMPERVARIRDYLTARPGASTLSGLALLFGTIPLLAILFFTVIGWPLIPLVVLIVIALNIVGLTALLTWFGYKAPFFKNKKSPVGAMLIGLVIILLISLIPWIGPVAISIAAFIAAGATLLSRFGSEPKNAA
jgi:hypothetical protein